MHWNSFPVYPQAANPGCVLEDFVRWYSPRDYVVEEVVDEMDNKVVKGELSARMKIPGNMWVEAWETARVTPARRQRRLFDDTKEAEKVLFGLPGWYTYNWHQKRWLNILVCSVKLFPGVFSGSALLSSAETCRLDLQPPALHTPCWDSEVEGGGWVKIVLSWNQTAWDAGFPHKQTVYC